MKVCRKEGHGGQGGIWIERDESRIVFTCWPGVQVSLFGREPEKGVVTRIAANGEIVASSKIRVGSPTMDRE